MTKLFLLSFICICTLRIAIAQEKGTYQADSIYKVNKVKLRKWYSGNNKKLGAITYYDLEGRMSKYQVFMDLGSSVRTTHYIYDNNGKIINQVDSTTNGKPDKSEVKRLKKMRINPNMILSNAKNRAPLEISKYELTYENNSLTKLVKFNPDETIDYEDEISLNGLSVTRKWYKNSSLYRESTTQFIQPNYKEKYTGWEIRNGEKQNWVYTFEYEFENSRVTNYIRYDQGEQKETTEFRYNENGLLISTKGYILEQFEYEYNE